MTDEAYCRLRALLANSPEHFTAVREGLAIMADALDAHVLWPADADALPRAAIIFGATADCWLLRATRRYWLLHPEAFDCTDEVPSGVHDQRWDSIVTLVEAGRRMSDMGQTDEQGSSCRAVETGNSWQSLQPVFDDGWQ